MGTYTIGEVAECSGLPATALRYYEGIGLVQPAGRSAGGYRLYDDRGVARLAFIARAKQLGCSLQEITELVAVWNGDRCDPVQRRLQELVSTKLGDAEHQISELAAFITQLRAAAAQLAGDPVDGSCGDDCACLHEPTGTFTVTLGVKRADPPIACTLGAGELADRFAQSDQLLDSAVGRCALASGGIRVEFPADVDVGSPAILVHAEQACCALFRFAVTIDQRWVGLEIDAPPDAADVVSGMFGAAS